MCLVGRLTKINMKIVAVVAAYNEERALGKVVQDLLPHVSSVVVVNDGSKDNTAAVAKMAGATVISHFVNRGQGAALETGNRYALKIGADIIVHFDADGQHSITDLPKFIAPLQAGVVDMVLGSRFLGNVVDLPWSRRVVLQLGLLFVRTYSGLKLTDAQNGYRAFSRGAAEKIRITEDGMAHASQILDKIAELKLRYVEVPVTITYTAETLAKGQRSSNAFNIVGRLLWDKFLR